MGEKSLVIDWQTRYFEEKAAFERFRKDHEWEFQGFQKSLRELAKMHTNHIYQHHSDIENYFIELAQIKAGIA